MPIVVCNLILVLVDGDEVGLSGADSGFEQAENKTLNRSAAVSEIRAMPRFILINLSFNIFVTQSHINKECYHQLIGNKAQARFTSSPFSISGSRLAQVKRQGLVSIV